jgi:hypothetical protein
LLANKNNKKGFVHFQDFVETPRPWGLGTEYPKFRALIASEIGEREFDRLTASEPMQGERTDITSVQNVPKLNGAKKQKSKLLRAIYRAPAIIQRLYDQDLLAVDLAAKFGPRTEDPKTKREMEGRARLLQERLEAQEGFCSQMSLATRKRELNKAAREILSIRQKTPLENLQYWWRRASPEERAAFRGFMAQA